MKYHLQSLLMALDLLDKPCSQVVYGLRLQLAAKMGRLVRDAAEREGLNG